MEISCTLCSATAEHPTTEAAQQAGWYTHQINSWEGSELTDVQMGFMCPDCAAQLPA